MSDTKTGTRFDDPQYGIDIIGLVGEGANGKTFLGRAGDTFVILKVSKERQSKESFIAEGKSINEYGSNASLNVLVIGGETEGYDLLADEPPFLILDYLPGITLHDFLEVIRGNDEKPNEFSDLMKYKIIFGIAQGLNLLHQKGVSHRDVKPGNIFLDQDFNPHIGDFGDLSPKVFTDNKHGTENFLPPEAYQPDGDPIPCDPPYDVFEFGGTLFQILTYEWPFNDKDDESILETYTAQGKRDERVESGEITLNEKDEPLYQIVKMCWEQDPSARPTMDDISHWIYEAAPGILGKDFDEFNDYACSLGGKRVVFGTIENVHKAIANGFAEVDKTLRKVADLEGIPIGNFNECVQGFTEYRNRPPTKSKRVKQ